MTRQKLHPKTKPRSPKAKKNVAEGSLGELKGTDSKSLDKKRLSGHTQPSVDALKSKKADLSFVSKKSVDEGPEKQTPGDHLRHQQVLRVYRVLTLLETARIGYTIKELRDQLEQRGLSVTERTVYRDIEGLRQAGFPIVPRENPNGGEKFILEQPVKISNYLVLTSNELFALYLSQSALTPLQDTPFFADIKGVFNKISEKISTQGRGYMDELRNAFSFEGHARWGLGIDPEVTSTLRSACQERQLVKIAYKGIQDSLARERVVGPEFLYFAKGGLYFIARDLESGRVKTFSCARMESALMLETIYNQAPIDPGQFFSGSFGVYRSDVISKIELRFAPELALFIGERQWHPSQVLKKNSDHSLDFSLEVGLTPELLQWVLGFGSHVTVLEPKSLQLELVEEARKLITKYQNPSIKKTG
jgi:predicted DNA-binding transcriptional regulator YafY